MKNTTPGSMPSGPARSPATIAAPPREVTDAEEHRRDCRDVVSGIRDAGLEPALGCGLGGERRLDAIAERDEAPDEEDDVDEVQIADRQRQEFLDRGAAVEHHQAGRGDHGDRADEPRQAEQVVRDLARGRAHHGEHDHDQQEIADLEQEPAAAEQQLEERAVVVRLAMRASSKLTMSTALQNNMLTIMPSTPPHGPAGRKNCTSSRPVA